MTIQEAIQQAREIEENQYSIGLQTKWLNDIDSQIYQELIQTHEKPIVESFEGYENASPETELLVHDAYSQLYVWYLIGHVQLANGDIDRYPNTQTMFNEAYGAYERWYNRTHMPKGPHRFVY